MIKPFVLPRPQRSFTLVEILVAVGVLSLILATIAQMLSSTVKVTGLSDHQMNASQSARLVLDALNKDLASLLSQNGNTVCVLTNNGSVQIAFLSAARGPVSAGSAIPASDFRCMAVRYLLTNNQVIRSAESIAWSQTTPMQELLSPTGTAQLSALASHILAFDAVLNLDNGQTVFFGYSPGTNSLSWTTNMINGALLPNNYLALILSKYPLDSSNPRVRAITVSVAALDGQTFRIPNVTNMSALLSAPTIVNQTPVESWNDAIRAGNLNGFPSAEVAAIHFDQRTFPIK